MFRLSDFYKIIMKKPLPTDCGIACEIVDPRMAILNRSLTESVSCFSYTLVTTGSSLVRYNDNIIQITKNDLLIYTPGTMIHTVETSEDFSAVCLLGDQTTTFEIPYARNVISASYFPFVVQAESKFPLTDREAENLYKRMMEIMTYINSDHFFKKECLYSLYSLFILDLLNVEEKYKRSGDFNTHTTDLFLKFLRLLTENFQTHHDISFYADSLAVTTIYLSRIVKRFSRQTVKNHVDRMLVMEASYLLRTTDQPISTIAENLRFATPAGFCKFFKRHKGLSPKEYRMNSGSLKA